VQINNLTFSSLNHEVLYNYKYIIVVMTLPLIVGPLYMLITVAILAVLFWKKSMSKRAAMIILTASVVVAGFLQWGFLDTTIYLHQVLYGIINGGINSTQAFKVVLILASSLVLGRLFCGYICPLGAAQELISRLVKKQTHIDVKILEAIRAVFFMAFIVIGIGTASIVHFNPFSLSHHGLDPSSSWCSSSLSPPLYSCIDPGVLYYVLSASS
jgi:Polyferredoxin